MRRAFTLLMLALAGALLAGCSASSSDTGSARFAVSVPQALSSDISRVSVTSSASDIPSVSIDLAPTHGVWGGIIGNIPAGSNRSFLAQAFDSSGTLLFEGCASGVTISESQTALVAITLQQLHPPPSFDNEAPLIDSLIASSTSVPAAGAILLVARAHDPNPGDTLSFSWSATSGSFSSPSEAVTLWTAPASTGIETLTLTVTDSRGLASSIVLAVNVTHGGGEGDAQLSISFNSSPQVASLSATPTQLAVGQMTAVSVSASDPDGDSLSYSWSASCAGTWTNASASSAQFTPSLLPAGSCNNCRLTVSISDGRGGQNTGTVALCIRNTPPANHLNPVIIRSYGSSAMASPGQVLTFEVVASDPEGSALTSSWEANTGSLGTPSSDASRSRITWTAPSSCITSHTPPSVTVTITNAFNLTATRSFPVRGLPVCPGHWIFTSPMLSPAPRWGHTATLLPDGKVLVAGGGADQAGIYHASAEVYDPASDTWSCTGSMNERRVGHTATLLPDGKVLVTGGESITVLNTAELYDPASGTWSYTGSMAQSRSFHTATLLPNGQVLVTGRSGFTSDTATELYDPASGTWSPAGAMAEPHSSPATLLSDGKVLAAGETTAELYNPATGTWSATGSPLKPISGSATLLPNGQVLVAGGTTAELYNPAAGTWSATHSMVEPRAGHTATLLLDGKVLVTGGRDPDSYSRLATAELYDPASGTWSLTHSMAEPRDQHTATLLPNGQVLVVGNPSGDKETAELYTP